MVRMSRPRKPAEVRRNSGRSVRFEALPQARSDCIVSDRFQTHGDDELSSHVTKEYLGERTVSSLNAAGSRYADVIRGC